MVLYLSFFVPRSFTRNFGIASPMARGLPGARVSIFPIMQRLNETFNRLSSPFKNYEARWFAVFFSSP